MKKFSTGKNVRLLFKNFIIVAIFALFITLAVGSLDTETATNTNSNSSSSVTQKTTETKPGSAIQETTEKKPNLEILDYASESDEYCSYVVGRIKNNTNKTYSYAQVTISLYDSSGAQVGSTLANVNNLEPGSIWKFKALVTEKSTKKFKITDVTGF